MVSNVPWAISLSEGNKKPGFVLTLTLSAHTEAENGANGVAVGGGVEDGIFVGVNVAVGCRVSREVEFNVGTTTSTGVEEDATDRPGSVHA
jgi:hypothetical protein